MKLAAIAVAMAAIAFAAPRAHAEPVDRWPGVAAAYVVEVDGVTRWAHDAGAGLPPASLTKILTALVVIEAVGDDALVTVSARAASAQGARIGLRRGMQLPVGVLLSSMLLRSANDA
jgi:D-alanyl-D-alanine carboxypeptidase (penicillin-binding protein 5/6)